MSAFRPRDARPEDVPEILAMVRELADYERSLPEARATVEQLNEALFGARRCVFAHVVDAPADDERAPVKLAGFSIWFLNFSTWLGVHGAYLEDLYVRPRFRGHGIGRALMRAIAKECADNGWGRFEWSVLDWNEPAIAFYRSLGARPMDEWTVWRLTGDDLVKLGRSAG